VEHIRDSPKVNECVVWPVARSFDRTLFFAEATVTSSNYLHMLEKIVYPQLQELKPAVFFQ
jgi:hypothetical protein